jgi:hypothetical protein
LLAAIDIWLDDGKWEIGYAEAGHGFNGNGDDPAKCRCSAGAVILGMPATMGDEKSDLQKPGLLLQHARRYRLFRKR